jgi:hypothetical protein
MQTELAHVGLDGLSSYPVVLGASGWGAVVQFRGDGWSDPHEIFMQLATTRTQWTCFLESVRRGIPEVIDPALGCP